MVGLKDSVNKKASAFSKGMKLRLVFARALLNNPEILFLDEPTSGLDPATANRINSIITDKKKDGCTVFLTTHNMYAAEKLCDRVAFLYNGKIMVMDSPRNLKLKYGQKSVNIEYKNGDAVITELLFLDNEADKQKFNEIVKNKDVQTIHSQEATLEQIFIKLTGRGLE